MSKSQPHYCDDDFVHPIDSKTGLAYAPHMAPPSLEPPAPLDPNDSSGTPPDDAEYIVESIISAKKIGRVWHLEIKWLGYSETTWETRRWIQKNAGKDVRLWADKAIAEAIENQLSPILDEDYDERAFEETDDCVPDEVFTVTDDGSTSSEDDDFFFCNTSDTETLCRFTSSLIDAHHRLGNH